MVKLHLVCLPNCRVQRRTAMSLLEVMIATGILAASTVLLLGMLTNGLRHGERGERQVIAQILCQSKLEEVIADPRTLREASDEPLEGSPDWRYSLQWSETEVPGLVRVHVRVMWSPSAGNVDDTRLDRQPAGIQREVLAIPGAVQRGQLRPTFELVRLARIRPPTEFTSRESDLALEGAP